MRIISMDPIGAASPVILVEASLDTDTCPIGGELDRRV
jgi:hypothetical protein